MRRYEVDEILLQTGTEALTDFNQGRWTWMGQLKSSLPLVPAIRQPPMAAALTKQVNRPRLLTRSNMVSGHAVKWPPCSWAISLPLVCILLSQE